MSGSTPLITPKHRTEPNMKGESLQAGTNKWIVSGVQPPRDIPWVEIFEQHISIIEGHVKMMDMIRQHTVPDTDDWRKICPMLERAKEMLRMTNGAKRNFVPTTYDEKSAPLRSSLASVNSPPDYEYSKVKKDKNRAKAKGVEVRFDAEVPQDEKPQDEEKGTPIKASAAKPSRRDSPGSTSDLDSEEHNVPASNSAPTNGHAAATKKKNGKLKDNNPYFAADINATSVKQPNFTNRSIKRSSEARSPEETVVKKLKKAKTQHDGDVAELRTGKRVEFEDISNEVDARMKEKEDKRKRKEEKKRKRQSEDSLIDTEPTEVAVEVEKPKKKRPKKSGVKLEGKLDSDGADIKKRSGSHGEEEADHDKKKKKKRKTSKLENVE